MQTYGVAFVLVLLGTGLVLNLAVLLYVGARCLRVLLRHVHRPHMAQHLLALAHK